MRIICQYSLTIISQTNQIIFGDVFNCISPITNCHITKVILTFILSKISPIEVTLVNSNEIQINKLKTRSRWNFLNTWGEF